MGTAPPTQRSLSLIRFPPHRGHFCKYVRKSNNVPNRPHEGHGTDSHNGAYVRKICPPISRKSSRMGTRIPESIHVRSCLAFFLRGFFADVASGLGTTSEWANAVCNIVSPAGGQSRHRSRHAVQYTGQLFNSPTNPTGSRWPHVSQSKTEKYVDMTTPGPRMPGPRLVFDQKRR